VLERIAAVDDDVRAYMEVLPETARAEARAVDARRERGERLPLDGLPVAIKDNIAVAGARWTAGSRLFADRVATTDAEAVRRLRAAGAVIVGKVTTHELAYGCVGHNGVTGWTHNPWDLARVPGGSSAGSGASLGADTAVGALGTDTGGSIRIPAHFNGITGLRPTYGAVSVRGSTPLGAAYDSIGPMARHARDVAAIHAAIAGHDHREPLSADRTAPDVLTGLEDGVGGLRVGVLGGYFAADLAPGVAATLRALADVLAGLGADVTDHALPGAADAVAAWRPQANTMALAGHRAALEATPELFSEDVARLLRGGYDTSGVQLADFLLARTRWQGELIEAFEDLDVLVCPTVPCPAPAIGSPEMEDIARITGFTSPFALAHVPALSLPGAPDPDGLPLGVQLVARWWDEPVLLRAAVAVQAATDWHTRRPG
jgi:aspartyl-tRNA(Asn)/glutamyl-tRNA(Gln) amidotransferase subunit A